MNRKLFLCERNNKNNT